MSSKIGKIKEKLKEKEKRKEITDYEKLSKFYNTNISNYKLKIRNASIMNSQRIRYCRGKDLYKFFTENYEEIRKFIKNMKGVDLGEVANEISMQKFYEINLREKTLLYLTKMNGDDSKFPKKLVPLTNRDDPSRITNFDKNGFYYLVIEEEKSNMQYIYLILLVIFILFIVLFPIWPLSMKLGVIYILYGLIIFLVAFLILSIIAVILGVIFGYDVYIMPHVDDYKMSMKDRLFKDFVILYKRDDSWGFFFCRVAFGLSLLSLGILAYFFPYLPKLTYNVSKKLFIAGIDLIKKKITEFHTNKNAVKIKAPPSFDDLNNL